MDNRKIIASNLRKIRIQRNYSQAFVANQVGISQRTMTRAETLGNISDKILKRLCMFYRISISELYNESVDEGIATVAVVPDAVLFSLMMKNSFISEVQIEIIHRYNNILANRCTMLRDDVEVLLKSVISNKKHYTLSDVISCCLMINQETISNALNIVLNG